MTSAPDPISRSDITATALGATRARRGPRRAQASAPALLRRGLRVGVGDEHDGAALEIAQADRRGRARAALRGSRTRVRADRSRTPRSPPRMRARAHARARPRRRSVSHEPQQLGRPRRACAPAAARPRLSATRSSSASTPSARLSSDARRRASARRRRAPGRRGRARQCSRRAPAAARTTVGSPAPDSTAAVISSRAARSSSADPRRALKSGFGPRPRERAARRGRPRRSPSRRRHTANEPGDDALPEARVRGPGGHQDHRNSHAQADDRTGADGDVDDVRPAHVSVEL